MLGTGAQTSMPGTDAWRWCMVLMHYIDALHWCNTLIQGIDAWHWCMALIHGIDTCIDTWHWCMVLIHSIDDWYWYTPMVHGGSACQVCMALVLGSSIFWCRKNCIGVLLRIMIIYAWFGTWHKGTVQLHGSSAWYHIVLCCMTQFPQVPEHWAPRIQ